MPPKQKQDNERQDSGVKVQRGVSGKLVVKRSDMLRAIEYRQVPPSEIYESRYTSRPAMPAYVKLVIGGCIGMGLWLVSALYYAGYLGIMPPYLSFWEEVIWCIFWIALFVIVIILSAFELNAIAFVFYLPVAWLSGLVQSSILVWVGDSAGLDITIARYLFVGSVIIAVFSILALLVIGIWLAERYDLSIWSIFLSIFGTSLVFSEILLILLFGWDVVIFGTSILVVLWVVAGVLIDAKHIKESLDEGLWMLALLWIFLNIIALAVRIFIILVKIWASTKDD